MRLFAWIMMVTVGLLSTACHPGGNGIATIQAASSGDTPAAIPLTPAPEPPGMTEMLAVHNRERAVVGVASLAWSGGMSAYAQEWANHLANHNQCRMQHRSAAGTDRLRVGENLYWASPVHWTDGTASGTTVQPVTPEQVAQFWAAEKVDYHADSNTCTPGKRCGHYTQMVWNTSREVGCATALCADKGQIWVCNYNPPGNWLEQKPY